MRFPLPEPGPGRTTLFGVPPGSEAAVLAALARDRLHLHLVEDEAELETLTATLAFFSPGTRVLRLPGWDCLPFERVSPAAPVQAQRMQVLRTLATWKSGEGGVLLATVATAMQRLPHRDTLGEEWRIAPGDTLDTARLPEWLVRTGHVRRERVMEPGEFCFRGGLVDLFPPGSGFPCRIDLEGDRVGSLRRFDPLTQMTTGMETDIVLARVGEILIDDPARERFRNGYRRLFGMVHDDPLYMAVSGGQHPPGIEHWLPLFCERTATLADHVPGATVSRAPGLARALVAWLDLIASRHAGLDGAERSARRIPPPSLLYLDEATLEASLAGHRQLLPSPFPSPGDGAAPDTGMRALPPLAADSSRVAAWIGEQAQAGRRVVIACDPGGHVTRMAQFLNGHGVTRLQEVHSLAGAGQLSPGVVLPACFPLSGGFSCGDWLFVPGRDVAGVDPGRGSGRKKGARRAVLDADAIAAGDFLVHRDHGIGRYDGLVTLDADGARHDCLVLVYADGDRLYVPVENISCLGRLGAVAGDVVPDRLGSAAWQKRKAAVRKRLRDLSGQLVRIAALRRLRKAPVCPLPRESLEKFREGFPFGETTDQEQAIGDTLADLGAGIPMDRLVCGDVGFGKTEIALRAALAVVLSGWQVMVLCPTTLLARQHYETFCRRFRDFPVRIGQLSRLVPAAAARRVRQELAAGTLDIVIGTHALLGRGVSFRAPGLAIVDEEQHFGVAQKERIKELRAGIHVLTLTATPIPRTFQLSLAGLREMSLISTPPVSRLSVRTVITPFDPAIVREAILRERHRGGQIYYVVPRIRDLEETGDFLRRQVPEVRFAILHGQTGARRTEETMEGFCRGDLDLLLSTAIVESGLDIPAANTMIVHRSEMFGLAQLHQLRGRIGRSGRQGCCCFTYPASGALPALAERRLRTLSALDSLGAGFHLASHDLDARGAGNLLGEEQSGQIREVGVELYQQMLEEAVASARGEAREEEWSPQVSLGVPARFPESYIPDLDLRLALYRRAGHLEDQEEVGALAAEMVDRFGSLPEEAENFLALLKVRLLCRQCNVDRLECGPAGILAGFHGDRFPAPDGLFVWARKAGASFRPDQRVFIPAVLATPAQRLEGSLGFLRTLAGAGVRGAGDSGGPGSGDPGGRGAGGRGPAERVAGYGPRPGG